MSERSPKRLIIRLSSLGDVILSTSSLSALPPAGETHWVVSREYAELLRGHPRIKKVWEFDRAGGLGGWFELMGKLWKEGFTEVFDLHNSLRSRMARMYFRVRAKFEKRELAWKTLSKERWKLSGLFFAKRLWPQGWYPSRLVERFAKLVGGNGSERPDLTHLAQKNPSIAGELGEWLRGNPDYLCVMPASKWDGKKWGVRGFYEVISGSGLPVVVLGQKGDRESQLLAKMLEQSGYPHFSAVGQLKYGELATLLSKSRGYFGNDTGLAHLAEAVGTAVVTVFGPTIPAMGFGPWREKSRAVGADVWCKPCSKDGRVCLRLDSPYACQTQLKPALVSRELAAFLES